MSSLRTPMSTFNKDEPKKHVQNGRHTHHGKRPAIPDHLALIKLPNGTTLGQLTLTELTKLCMIANVPGASWENGRQQNAECLADVLNEIGRAAAEKAITEWFGVNAREAAQ